MTLAASETTGPVGESALWADAEARAAGGDLAGALATLLSGLDRFPFYRYALQVTRWVRERDGIEGLFPDHRRVRLALAGSFTLEPLATFVEVECLRSGLWPRVHVGGFNQFRSQILDADSVLYRAAPEIVFLATTPEALVPGVDPFGEISRSKLEEAVTALVSLAGTLTERSSALVVVQNFAVSPWLPEVTPADPRALGPRSFVRALNLRLAEAFRGDPRVLVFDFEFLAASHGTRRLVDPKLRYLAGLEVGEEILPALARGWVGYAKTLKGLARKCIVVDLDGTLWGGVVGEDGLDGIRLGPDGVDRAYQDFQRSLLALWRRGVLLAINSRNNTADALEVLRAHPGMVLREEHFASAQINWGDKTENMARIAAELSLGLDALVFVDDNPAERLRMRGQLPAVLTLELPPDPTRYVEALGALNDFQPLALTDEDRRRGALYAAERARNTLRVEAQSIEDYLRALAMTLIVQPLADADVARAAQLTQKTNQFNLTTRRYSATELQRRGGAFTLRVMDAFGDNGLVGVAVVDRGSDVWHLDTFLMSCRVLGRRIEQIFVERIAARAQKSGATRLTAEFIPTSRNQVAAEFLPACGFREIGPGASTGARRFELALDGRELATPDWLTMVE